MATKVNIIANEKGALVTPYQSDATYGYVHLETTATSINGGWLRESKRTHLLKGTTELLEKYVSTMGSNGTLPGCIAIVECVESNIPAEFAKQLNKDLTHEEAIKNFLKRAGKDGDVLTAGGERILRFTVYDPSGTRQDVLVAHDNTPEQ